jgi:hypothetical protein
MTSTDRQNLGHSKLSGAFMNKLGKMAAALGAVLLTATALALPDMSKVKAPTAIKLSQPTVETSKLAVNADAGAPSDILGI